MSLGIGGFVGGDMVVYLDWCFLVNFALDLLILILHECVLGRSATKMALLASAALGGVYAVVAVIIYSSFFKGQKYVLLLMFFASVIIMPCMLVKICHPALKGRASVRASLLLLLVAAVVGGACGALYECTLAGYYFRTALNESILPGALLFLAFIFTSFCIRGLNFNKKYGEGVYEVELTVLGRRFYVSALLDTGNRLCDKISGAPIHIIEKDILNDVYNLILTSCENAVKTEFHTAFYNTIDAKNSMLYVIKCESMRIGADGKSQNRERTRVYENVLVGLSDVKLSSDGAYSMLLNSHME